MNTVKHNIEKEEKFIELFGYSLVGPNGSNRWFIFDENNNQVGFIQYKKTYNGNSKKGLAKEYGYHTFIDSSKIKYDNTRTIDNKKDKTLDSSNFNYSFYIKRKDDDLDYVEMRIGDSPSLNVWSKEHGFIDFRVDYNGLFLDFKSKTNSFNIQELLVYRNFDIESYRDKEYVYQIRSCKKEVDLSGDNSKGVTSREISGTQRYDFDNRLKVARRTWVNSRLRFERENTVDGTVEEMAIKHEMGIDCFKHFRFLINKIIPFKDDVVSLLVSPDCAKKANLSLFLPDYVEKETEVPVQKVITPNKN